MSTILVTGVAGFIGSNFVDEALGEGYRVIGVDKLTYCGNLDNLTSALLNDNFKFVKGDAGDIDLIKGLLQKYAVEAVVHLAAQTHVDRSIKDPSAFLTDNVIVTQRLLEASLQYWRSLGSREQERYRHIHISTDEVFGELSNDDPPFTEQSSYRPNSPYSASKAAGDMFVRAYGQTYGLPVITVHPSNNYGPRQFPEKLIPLMIYRALAGLSLPIYGTGKNQRDWLYVKDHCQALLSILRHSKGSEVFNIGSGVGSTNLEVVTTLCELLDQQRPKKQGRYIEQLVYVADRAGHDWRYVLNNQKAREELDFKVSVSLQDGLQKTLQWYLEHEQWVERVISGEYRQWEKLQYGALK